MKLDKEAEIILLTIIEALPQETFLKQNAQIPPEWLEKIPPESHLAKTIADQVLWTLYVLSHDFAQPTMSIADLRVMASKIDPCKPAVFWFQTLPKYLMKSQCVLTAPGRERLAKLRADTESGS